VTGNGTAQANKKDWRESSIGRTPPRQHPSTPRS
jgi:hypothetical protein